MQRAATAIHRRSHAQIGCSARSRQPRSHSACAIVSLATAAGTLPRWRVARCDSEGVVCDSDRQASITISSSPVASCAHVPHDTCPPVPADRIRHMGRALRMTTCTRTSRCTSSSVVLPLLRPLMCAAILCARVPWRAQARPRRLSAYPHGAVCNATVLTHAEIVATHYGCVWPLPPSPATSRPTRSATAPSRV